MFLIEFTFQCENTVKKLTSGRALNVEQLAGEVQTIAEACGNLVAVRLIAENRVPLNRTADATARLAAILATMETFPHVETRNTAIGFVHKPLPETSIIANPLPRYAPSV